MKRKLFKLGIFAVLCGMVFVSCGKDNLREVHYNTIITVKSADAKTHYNPATHGVEWDEDDQISVIRGNSSSSNAFVPFDIIWPLSDNEAQFGSNETLASTGAYFAVYPAQDDLSISQGRLSCVAIQPEQTLTENTFGLGNNTAVGYDASTTMQFRNVGGLAKIALRGTALIKSVKITNNGTGKISGRGVIDVTSDDLAITWDADNSSKEIIVKAADQTNGEDVSGTKIYYFVMPPCTLSNYTITITDIDGEEHSKTITTSLTISRSTVTMLGAFEVNAEPVFSVSATQKVYFSPGNLKCHTMPDPEEWSFSTTIGYPTVNNLDTYRLWQYFYRSTDDEGNNYGRIIGTNYDVLTLGHFVDWGSNPYLQSDLGTGWRTPSSDEWTYLISTRPNHDNLRGSGTVNGIHGYILLPDRWSCPPGLSFVPLGEYDDNVYTTTQWNKMAGAGAVFLPASGSVQYSYESFVFDLQGVYGYYWCSDELYTTENVDGFYFGNNFCYPHAGGWAYHIQQVRLVKNAN